MGRSNVVRLMIVCSAIVTGLLASSPSAKAGGNCEAKLVSKSYDCSFSDNDFPPFTECWSFFTGGASQYFDLDNGFDDYGCACNPAGSTNTALFDNSGSAFECSDNNQPFMFNGKIKGKKLSVQGVGSSGEQYVGTCVPRSSPCL